MMDKMTVHHRCLKSIISSLYFDFLSIQCTNKVAKEEIFTLQNQEYESQNNVF